MTRHDEEWLDDILEHRDARDQGSRPIRVRAMSDRGHLHRVGVVINKVQHSIVPAARGVCRS